MQNQKDLENYQSQIDRLQFELEQNLGKADRSDADCKKRLKEIQSQFQHVDFSIDKLSSTFALVKDQVKFCKPDSAAVAEPAAGRPAN